MGRILSLLFIYICKKHVFANNKNQSQIKFRCMVQIDQKQIWISGINYTLQLTLIIIDVLVYLLIYVRACAMHRVITVVGSVRVLGCLT